MATPLVKTYFKTFKTDRLGQIFMTGILNVKAYDKVSLEIVPGPGAPALSMTVQTTMGKLSGTTLGHTVDSFPLSPKTAIHAYDVIGPEFSVVLTGGPANTNVPIQAWVFLH